MEPPLRLIQKSMRAIEPRNRTAPSMTPVQQVVAPAAPSAGETASVRATVETVRVGESTPSTVSLNVPAPAPSVTAWVAVVLEVRVHVPSVTVGEPESTVLVTVEPLVHVVLVPTSVRVR